MTRRGRRDGQDTVREGKERKPKKKTYKSRNRADGSGDNRQDCNSGLHGERLVRLAGFVWM